MLSVLFAVATAALQPPLATRRFAVGAGLAAALPALPASANNEGAAKYASGYVPPPSPFATVAELKAKLYAPYSAALAKDDYSSIGSLYAPSATLVNGVTKGQSPTFVKGSDIAQHFAGRGLSKASLSVGNVFLEGETQDIAHVAYVFESKPGAKPIAGQQRAVRKDGVWQIDEDVFPLENGKVYNMLKPQRDLLAGKVFLSLDPALKLK
jgi:hypothetical protein